MAGVATRVYDVKAVRGDKFVHDITVKNSDGTTKDVSAATAVKYTVKDRYGGTAKLSYTLGSGTSVVGAVISISIDTSTLTATTYVYDCEVTLGGQIITVQKGDFILELDVS